MIRLFYATDLHGSDICFSKFLAAARVYHAETLILGGDITGKIIVPFIEDSSGAVMANFLGRQHILRNPTEREKAWRLCSDMGYYPYLTNASEKAELESDPGKADRLWLKVATEKLQRWVDRAAAVSRGTVTKVYLTGGNDDDPRIIDQIEYKDPVIYAEGKVLNIAEKHEIISCGFSNRTPWDSPREVTEDQLEAMIESMAKRVHDLTNALFNLHVPPRGIGLDEAPKLDDKLRVRDGTISAGSIAVRKLIEKYEPLLGLHGHIHESRGARYLGRTLCINPGSEYADGTLRGVVLNLDDGRVRGYLLTSG